MSLSRIHAIKRGKVAIIGTRLYTRIYCEVRIYLYPLAGIAHKGEVKAPVPGILHPRKFGLEAWLYGMWTSHAIPGTEVERLVIPLAVDIDKIIAWRIFRRCLDIFRPQDCLNE